jgi:1-acyl-sn-glycerol-3-phosphate acyltransferase
MAQLAVSRPEPIYRSALAVAIALVKIWRPRRTETGLANLPDTGGAVLAMTHFGYLEFVLVEWSTWTHNRRRIRFLATKRAFDTPVVGWILRGTHQIAVDRDAGAAAYADAVVALRNGELIGVFPEAGVSASFEVRELKTGAARLAAEAGVPIIPVAVWGGQRLATKNRRIGFRDRFGVPVGISFGIPLVVTPTDDPHEASARLRTAMQHLVSDLQAHYPEDGTGRWWHPRSLGGTAPTPAEAAATDAERELRRRHTARA